MSREKTWDKNIQLLLVGIIAFNILPHIVDIPVWASAISYFFLAWKTLALTRGLIRPPTWFLYAVTIACGVGVFFEYRTLLGHEAASALLVILASAKLLETNRYRDAMFVIFTSFFLLMAHLLSSQTLISTLFMGMDVLLITALMFQLHKQERRNSPRALRPVMKLLALAIPVWIFLFFAFPRFSSGLWRLQSPESNSGFSENLDPGEIESLTDSQEPAFRINFESAVPPREDLYWRGSILTVGDGLRWSKPRPAVTSDDVLANARAGESLPSRGRTTEYQVFHEPRFRNWLFVLDYPETFSPSLKLQQHGSRKRAGLIYETQRPVSGRVVFSASSRQAAPLQSLIKEDRDSLLEVPKNLDPRIALIVKEWVDEAKTMAPGSETPTLADRIADRGFKWMIDGKFRYSKNPGALRAGTGAEQLSEFLFEKKVGFCEHYAAAFATLMRVAGVPARVTVGFQGGLRNEYGGYWLVRDLDAHAWMEIWREEANRPGVGRWVRVDPTSVIAPLRLRVGGEYNLLDQSELQANLDPAQFEARINMRSSQLYWKAAAAWDALQMNWNSFLSDFDFEFQKSLLEKLGFNDVTRLFLFALVGIGIFAFVTTLSFALRQRARRVDPLLKAWREFGRKLEKVGLERKANEGPLDFAERASQKFPNFAEDIRNLAHEFATLRYGYGSLNDDAGTRAKLREFRQSVRRFSIRANS